MFGEELGESGDGNMAFVRAVNRLEDIEGRQCSGHVLPRGARGVSEDTAGRLEGR